MQIVEILLVASLYRNQSKWHRLLNLTSRHPPPLTFELSDVIALFRRDSLSLRATGVAIVVSISTALAAAFSNDSDMVVG